MLLDCSNTPDVEIESSGISDKLISKRFHYALYLYVQGTRNHPVLYTSVVSICGGLYQPIVELAIAIVARNPGRPIWASPAFEVVQDTIIYTKWVYCINRTFIQYYHILYHAHKYVPSYSPTVHSIPRTNHVTVD